MADAAELSGKVAVVTGSARGMGRAITERFAGAGASVVVTDLDGTEGEAVATGIRNLGGRAVFVRADSGDEADNVRAIEAAISNFGRLDIFVANAGVHNIAAAADMPLEQFRALCRINLKGPFLGMKHAVNAIRRHGEGGAIVLISSVAGKIGLPGHTHYCAAKTGVKLMAKAAALELGPEKIRVNSIHPGGIRTQMTAFVDPDAFGAGVPMGRMGWPDEIAQAALFLASPRGQFITGAELVVDGGMIIQ